MADCCFVIGRLALSFDAAGNTSRAYRLMRRRIFAIHRRAALPPRRLRPCRCRYKQNAMRARIIADAGQMSRIGSRRLAWSANAPALAPRVLTRNYRRERDAFQGPARRRGAFARRRRRAIA